MAFLFNDLKKRIMIEVRLKTGKDKYSGDKAIKYVVQLGELKSYLTENALIELKSKLNTFAIPVVVGMLCECKEYDTLKYNEDMLLVCGNCEKPLVYSI